MYQLSSPPPNAVDGPSSNLPAAPWKGPPGAKFRLSHPTVHYRNTDFPTFSSTSSTMLSPIQLQLPPDGLRAGSLDELYLLIKQYVGPQSYAVTRLK